MDSQLTSKQLLQSFRMHDLMLPNRVAMAPMTRSRAGENRIPNELMATYYSQRASAGLIIRSYYHFATGKRLEPVTGHLHR